MATNRYAVILEETNGKRYKLCRILLTSDGSYFVTCPYHRSDKVFLGRRRINYKNPAKRAEDPHIEYSVVDDDDHRIKLSHHPDGFVQFSGEGILSGRNPNGSPKGLGVMSSPLRMPTAGPACGVTIQTPTAFKEADSPLNDDLVFRASDFYRTDKDTGLIIETYYFPAMWRRFVRHGTRGPVIWLRHPSSSVLELRVCMSPPDNWEIGFLGVDMWPAPINLGAESGFAVSSPTGKLQYDSDNELEGEALFAAYPAAAYDAPTSRINLAFRQRDDPPYTKGGKPPSID